MQSNLIQSNLIHDLIDPAAPPFSFLRPLNEWALQWKIPWLFKIVQRLSRILQDCPVSFRIIQDGPGWFKTGSGSYRLGQAEGGSGPTAAASSAAIAPVTAITQR